MLGSWDHYCVVIDADGKWLLSRRVANDEAALLELINAITACWLTAGAVDACRPQARVFRTADFVFIYAASCEFMYSLRTSCGVR